MLLARRPCSTNWSSASLCRPSPPLVRTNWFSFLKEKRKYKWAWWKEKRGNNSRDFHGVIWYISFLAGFNVETVKYKNIRFDCWDAGGQAKVRHRNRVVALAIVLFGCLHWGAHDQLMSIGVDDDEVVFELEKLTIILNFSSEDSGITTARTLRYVLWAKCGGLTQLFIPPRLGRHFRNWQYRSWSVARSSRRTASNNEGGFSR